MLKQLGTEMELTEHDYQKILKHIAKRASGSAGFRGRGMKCIFIDGPMYMLFIDRIDRSDADIKSRIMYHLYYSSSEARKHVSSAKDYFKCVRNGIAKRPPVNYELAVVIKELNKPEEVLLVEADLDVE